MLYSLIMSVVLSNGVVKSETLDVNLDKTSCYHKAIVVQDFADNELEHNDYVDVVGSEIYCLPQ